MHDWATERADGLLHRVRSDGSKSLRIITKAKLAEALRETYIMGAAAKLSDGDLMQECVRRGLITASKQ